MLDVARNALAATPEGRLSPLNVEPTCISMHHAHLSTHAITSTAIQFRHAFMPSTPAVHSCHLPPPCIHAIYPHAHMPPMAVVRPRPITFAQAVGRPRTGCIGGMPRVLGERGRSRHRAAQELGPSRRWPLHHRGRLSNHHGGPGKQVRMLSSPLLPPPPRSVTLTNTGHK